MGRLKQSKLTVAEQTTTKKSPKRALLSFGKTRISAAFIALVFLVSGVAVAFSPLAEMASAKTESQMNLNEKARSYATLNALRLCVRDEGQQQADTAGFVLTYFYISDANAKSGNWWRTEGSLYWGTTDGAARSGSYLNSATRSNDRGGDGKTLCNDILKEGLSLWGYESPLDLLCDAGVKRADGSPCREGGDQFGDITGYSDEIYNAVVKKVYGGSQPSLSETVAGTSGFPARYYLYQSAFNRGCMAVQSTNSADAQFVYDNVKVVDNSGNITEKRFVGGVSKTTERPIYIDRDGLNEVRRTCSQIANEMNTYAAIAGRYITANTDIPEGAGEDLCNINPNDPTCAPAEGEGTSCNVDGVGWIVCPILSFGAKLADDSYKFLADNFLAVNTGILATDPNATTQTEQGTVVKTGNGTFIAWGIIRNVANVAFVIVFLFVIFSQLTGMGVSNYGVKKVLPRLIIGAILVNISFYVCQILVDLSNIAGYGLKSVLAGVAGQIESAGSGRSAITGDDSGHLFGIITIIITAGVLVYFNLAAVMLAIIGGLVALLTIFVLLTARQALIVLLIVIAPLAFVAYLLPNTEQFFKRWQKMFTALLLLFPIIGLLYGACLIASSVLMQVAGDNVVMQIAAYLALVLPLLAVIPLLKGSLDAIPAIGNAIKKAGSKSSGLAQGGAKRGAAAYKGSNFGKYRSGVKAERKARIAAGTYTGNARNPLDAMRMARSNANRAINNNGVFNKATGGFGAEMELAAQKQERADLKEAIDMFGGDDALVQAWAQSGGSKKHRSYENLSQASKAQFDKMVEAGHHRKASSFLGAAQYLSESGKGDMRDTTPGVDRADSDVTAALKRAQSAGASATTVSGAAQAAIAAYRKSGRGDGVAEVTTDENMKSDKPAERVAKTAQQAWAEVAPNAVHRDSIKPGSASRAQYETYLQSNPENARKALVGYDSMEARAQASAQSAIVAAAQMHQYNATGATPTITTIQDAKTYFNVK